MRHRLLSLVSLALVMVGLSVAPAYAGPTASVLPTITGSPLVSFTLTGGDGQWVGVRDSTASIVDRWFHICSSEGCRVVSGSAAYTVTAEDLGFTIAFCVRASDPSGTTVECSNALAPVTNPPAPVNTAPPSVAGSAKIDAVLNGTTGNWSSPYSPSQLTYSTQWEACVDGGCSLRANNVGFLKVTQADYGKTLRFCVRVADPFGGVGTRCSNDTDQVAGLAPGQLMLELAGKVATGSSVSAKATVVGVPAAAITIEWSACDPLNPASCTLLRTDTNLASGSVTSLAVPATEAGRRIKVVARAKNIYGEAVAERMTSPVIAFTAPSCATLPPWEDPDGDGIKTLFECAPSPYLFKPLGFSSRVTESVNLPALGANPLRKDIFLQMDVMKDFTLSQVAVDRVVKAFKNAPVTNPDGSKGIWLHVDNGPDSPVMYGSKSVWGSRSISVRDYPHVSFPDPPWTQLDQGRKDLVSQGKAASRQLRDYFFHYGMLADRYGSTGSSGIAQSGDWLESGMGQNFLVTFGGWCDAPCSGSVDQQAGTLMHEFGHILGLGHGGRVDATTPDHDNYKPNYPSVMSYFWQMGLSSASDTPILDYSRSASSLPVLNENAVVESDGVRSTLFGFGVKGAFKCPGGDSTNTFALGAKQVDFDCNGQINTKAAKLDLNRAASGAKEKYTLLSPRQDWSQLLYQGGAVGDLGADQATGDPYVDLQITTLPPIPDVPVGQNVDTDATKDRVYQAWRAITKDTSKPIPFVTWSRRPRKGSVTVIFGAKDNKALDTVYVTVGRANYTLAKLKAAKRLIKKLKLRPGTRRFSVQAFDRSGFSKRLKGKLKVTCTKGRRCTVRLVRR